MSALKAVDYYYSEDSYSALSLEAKTYAAQLDAFLKGTPTEKLLNLRPEKENAK